MDKVSKTNLNKLIKWSSSKYCEYKKNDIINKVLNLKEGEEFSCSTGSYSEKGHQYGWSYVFIRERNSLGIDILIIKNGGGIALLEYPSKSKCKFCEDFCMHKKMAERFCDDNYETHFFARLESATWNKGKEEYCGSATFNGEPLNYCPSCGVDFNSTKFKRYYETYKKEREQCKNI